MRRRTVETEQIPGSGDWRGRAVGVDNVTIYDIASDAGVSIATVSRVLRGEANVSEATRKKVQDAIDRRNYRPSSIARGLTSKTTPWALSCRSC